MTNLYKIQGHYPIALLYFILLIYIWLLVYYSFILHSILLQLYSYFSFSLFKFVSPLFFLFTYSISFLSYLHTDIKINHSITKSPNKSRCDIKTNRCKSFNTEENEKVTWLPPKDYFSTPKFNNTEIDQLLDEDLNNN